MYDELAHIANTFGVFGNMSIFHEVVMRRWLPKGGDQWQQLRGRLFVNITRFFCRSEILSDWRSNDDIVDAMHASMHIPFYMNYLKPVRGMWAIDGGVSANTFLIDKRTMVVTALSLRGDIHPKSPLTAQDCFSPTSIARTEAIFQEAKRMVLPSLGGSDATPAESDCDTSLPPSMVPSSSSSAKDTADISTPTPFTYKATASAPRYAVGLVLWVLRAVEEPAVQAALCMGTVAVVASATVWRKR